MIGFGYCALDVVLLDIGNRQVLHEKQQESLCLLPSVFFESGQDRTIKLLHVTEVVKERKVLANGVPIGFGLFGESDAVNACGQEVLDSKQDAASLGWRTHTRSFDQLEAYVKL